MVTIAMNCVGRWAVATAVDTEPIEYLSFGCAPFVCFLMLDRVMGGVGVC